MNNQYEKKYEVHRTLLVYQMPKELDHHVAEMLCRELDMLVQSFGIQELELDFKNTEFMDSSGIGVVIGRSKTMNFRGGKLSASHISKRIAMMLRAVGLEKIVELKGEDE